MAIKIFPSIPDFLLQFPISMAIIIAGKKPQSVLETLAGAVTTGFRLIATR
jgi:aspartokinase-like uncharacterized kinase